MDLKVRNFYYLIAGILAILFAVTHAWNGQAAVLPTLGANAIAMDIRTVFMYVWHIITAENLVFGILFIFMSFQSERSKSRPVAWTIVSLLIVRLLVIVGITAWIDISALSDTLIDSIAIVFYIVLIILGLSKKQTVLGNESVDSRRTRHR
ncbi:hypothetical protein PAESOLCIP111_05866 [Paenibacillus solanacearum]|uniref:Uncharacterized protein n=1 Tax=Paenibacillus solanacearum TaxID=2048548 RepID=A0A916NYR9_9BACL|nr:hypothetical protein [Paenibacillus solanacearum]CAG7649430.1 hypothetical protein PAESOLCIP111_05866 [Paenibacillus solanacearum]